MSGEYGPNIVDGRPRYFSASSLTTADPNSYGGCFRAYHYKYVGGRKTEETAAMRKGKTELHAPIEHYIITGERTLGRLPMSGWRFIPDRKPNAAGRTDLIVEREIARPFGWKPRALLPGEEFEPYDLSLAPVRAAGIPLVGRIDLMHGRGEYIDSDGNVVAEKQPTIEITDWKSTSSFDFAKTGEQLRTNIQMDVYDVYARLAAPSIAHVRRSHVSFLTKGASEARKATTLTDPAHVARRWEYIEALARTVVDVAAEKTPENVEANRKSCNSYGRNGCPHKSICSAARHNSLGGYFGGDTQPKPEIIPIMSLVKKLPDAFAGATVPVTTGPAGVSAALGLTVPPNNAIAALMAEEAAALAPIPTITPEVRAAFETVSAGIVRGLGQATFTGAAAQSFAVYGGQSVAPDAVYPGSGKIGMVRVDTIAELAQHAKDLGEYLSKLPKPASAPATAPAPVAPVVATVVAPAAPTVSVLPPEAPESNPTIAALPVEGMTPPAAPETGTAATLGVQPMMVDLSALSVETVSASPTTVAPQITTATLIGAVAEQPAPAKKRGRPPGPRKAKPTDGAPETATPRTESAGAPFVLYIDCVPSCEHESLQPHIDAWHTAIVEYYKADPPDMRCSGDKPLAFGGWKGVLAALARKSADELPRANYTIDTRGSEINATVAEALCSATTDGERVLDFYVRGV